MVKFMVPRQTIDSSEKICPTASPQAKCSIGRTETVQGSSPRI